MRRCWLFAVSLLLGCSEGKPLDPMDPESFQQFSGTVTVDVGGQKNVYEYFRDGSKMRIVPQIPAGGNVHQRFAIIIDQEAKTTTAISWGRKQYYVQPLSDKSAPSLQWQLPQSGSGHKLQVTSRKVLETATVDGHACAVEDMTVSAGAGSPYRMKMWTAKDLRGFPIRIETQVSAKPMSVTFSNVNIAPAHDPSAFAIPTGFTKAPAGG